MRANGASISRLFSALTLLILEFGLGVVSRFNEKVKAWVLTLLILEFGLGVADTSNLFTGDRVLTLLILEFGLGGSIEVYSRNGEE